MENETQGQLKQDPNVAGLYVGMFFLPPYYRDVVSPPVLPQTEVLSVLKQFGGTWPIVFPQP